MIIPANLLTGAEIAKLKQYYSQEQYKTNQLFRKTSNKLNQMKLKPVIGAFCTIQPGNG